MLGWLQLSLVFVFTRGVRVVAKAIRTYLNPCWLFCQLRLFFEGYAESALPLLNHWRDRSAVACFGVTSRFLKALPESRVATILLNTCSLSPKLATMAHWADWSLHRQGFNGDLTKQPRFVFVKGDFACIQRFCLDYLPLIDSNSRFVLVTGDTDATIPLQVDKRFSPNDSDQIDLLRHLHDDPRLIHWYAQNIDSLWSKLTPIPLGYWERGGTRLYRRVLRRSRTAPIRHRPLKVFCAHRVRSGRQWDKRRLVTEKSLNEWRDVVDYFASVEPSRFFATVGRYPFVMCVGGGGLDPCPKAWTALLAGAIPIIEANETTQAYKDLPVVYVESWQTLRLDREVLQGWLDQHAARFDELNFEQSVLRKLSMGYWLNTVLAASGH